MSNSVSAFTSSDEVFEWINHSINHERNLKAATFRLDRMQRLSAIAGDPWKDKRVIHVAGSKGKGSVCSMIASIFSAYGSNTAKYASPHIIDVRERISLAEGFFPEQVYVTAGNELHAIISSAGSLPGDEGPTYFELMTLYFFLCARVYKCDTLVVETGIGGRLDATNIMTPNLSIIMPIEREHCDLLGDSIRAIAGEKAGIIKKGRPVLVSMGQSDEALAVFRQRSNETSSPLLFSTDLVRMLSCSCSTRGCAIELVLLKSGAMLNLVCPMPARIQADNAACAVAACLYLLGNSQRTLNAIREGIKQARLPARFQIIQNTPFPIVVDGSHTPRSIRMLTETWRELFGKGGVLVFSTAEDKDPEKMADELGPFFKQVIVTRIPNGKTCDIKRIAHAFTSRGALVLVQESLNEALAEAYKVMEADSKRSCAGILISGSFYLAAAILAFFKEKDSPGSN